MFDIIQKITTKKHWYDNGKKFSEKVHHNPMYYLCDICNIISEQKIKDMPKINNSVLTTNISNDIYAHTKTKEQVLKNYTNFSPVDKVLCWGSLFDSLLNFFQRNAYRTEQQQSKYLLVFKDEKSKQLFSSLMEEATKLISVIYPEDYDENFGGILLVRYPKEYKPKPKTNYISENYVSDEQICAIKKLHGIFRSITSFFWFIDCKNNTFDIKTYITNQNQHGKIH
ncbi:MAG: hypothetical protein IKN73_01990 [Alphaproteobacteria bacterium]|nr:hypothetical protein [Alphaproteobacteria bacterium]